MLCAMCMVWVWFAVITVIIFFLRILQALGVKAVVLMNGHDDSYTLVRLVAVPL